MDIKNRIAEKEESRLEKLVENMNGTKRKYTKRKKTDEDDEHVHIIEPAYHIERDQSAKADAGKPRLSLVPPQVIFDIAQVREYGNIKYGDPENWKLVEMQRYVDAALRHFYKFIQDPNGKDEESGIAHYKHLACNIAFICEMMAGKIV